MIKNIEYAYDPYHDVVWISFIDFSESCGFGIPVDRRTDFIEVVDWILTGKYKQWLEWF